MCHQVVQTKVGMEFVIAGSTFINDGDHVTNTKFLEIKIQSIIGHR